MPAGVDIDLYKPAINEVRKKYSICMVGRIAPVKNNLLALEAMQELVDAKVQVSLSIIGSYLDKDKEYFESLKKYVEDNELSAFVTFSPGVPPSKLPAIYSSFEVGAQIIIEPLPIVRGDKAKFLRLFQNLISNSLKFRSEAPLVISISATLSGSYWVFCIKDNGMGFDQKNSEKIFELFARVVDREKFSGSGMGLSMCKRIIETQGGRIWAESQPGHGSCFYFTIPSILFDAKGKPQPISLRYT
jgi:signal transduction histidine kinase